MLVPNINMVCVLTKYTNTGLNANKRGLEDYGITDTTTTRLYRFNNKLQNNFGTTICFKGELLQLKHFSPLKGTPANKMSTLKSIFLLRKGDLIN